tara:strand:- start:1870 stop:2370 length:501 start_codon:yes stop_codon:yes gene_type:complete
MKNNNIISSSVKIINQKNLVLGKNIRIDDGVIIICQKKLIIESNVHIGPYCVIRSHEKLTIGKFSLISSFVDIFTAIDRVNDNNKLSHPMIKKKHFRDIRAPIKIGRYSFIGSHSVILPGSNLAEGTSIGALSLINFKTKSWNIYNGNPARNLGKRNKNLIKKNLK